MGAGDEAGALAIVTQSPRFTMAKASIVHFAVAAAMLRSVS
jgi:hypothetical protein